MSKKWQGFVAGCCFVTATLATTPTWLVVVLGVTTGLLMSGIDEAPHA